MQGPDSAAICFELVRGDSPILHQIRVHHSRALRSPVLDHETAECKCLYVPSAVCETEHSVVSRNRVFTTGKTVEEKVPSVM